MSHTLHYDDDAGYVILRVEGTVTMGRIKEMAPHVARLCAENRCHRLLNDMRVADINISAADLYDSPQVMEESNISRTLKRALVVPTSFKEALFLEKITRYRGHDLSVFSDVEKARQWLVAE